MLFYIYMYNRHVFCINPLSRVNTIVTISCRGRVVTNVVSTCDPTPLYYMQLNIIKLGAECSEYNFISQSFGDTAFSPLDCSTAHVSDLKNPITQA